MLNPLTETEARVLGALIEKELTTPEYYPLTLNLLLAACNQKNNRHPVTAYDDKTVLRALDALRTAKLALFIGQAGARVPKYAHTCAETLPLPSPEIALLCVLLLRGPQTAGELRTRCERMYPFTSVEAAENLLDNMAGRGEEALVCQLPRLPGRRECRYVHLLCGPPTPEELATAAMPEEPARRTLEAEEARLQYLECELTALRAELDSLREFCEKLKPLID